MPRSLLALVSTCLLAGPALAQEPAPTREGGLELEYHFDRLAGKTATYRIETESRIEQTIGGVAGEGAEEGGGEVASLAQETQQHRYERAAEGGGKVTITTRRVKARLEQADGVAEYDSLGGGPVPEVLSSLADRVGKPVTLLVSRRGKVEDVTGVRVSQRKGYKTSFLELPEEPVRFGGSWDRLDRQPMPPLGTLAYHFRYTLAGTERDEKTGQERFRIDAVVTAELEDAPRGAQMSVRLIAQEGRGYMLFDRDGLIHESLLESSIELEVKAPAGRQTQRVRTRSSQILQEVVETGQ